MTSDSVRIRYGIEEEFRHPSHNSTLLRLCCVWSESSEWYYAYVPVAFPSKFRHFVVRFVVVSLFHHFETKACR